MAELEDRVTAIEECYEFMLAYAAQGFPHTSIVNLGVDYVNS